MSAARRTAQIKETVRARSAVICCPGERGVKAAASARSEDNWPTSRAIIRASRPLPLEHRGGGHGGCLAQHATPGAHRPCRVQRGDLTGDVGARLLPSKAASPWRSISRRFYPPCLPQGAGQSPGRLRCGPSGLGPVAAFGATRPPSLILARTMKLNRARRHQATRVHAERGRWRQHVARWPT